MFTQEAVEVEMMPEKDMEQAVTAKLVDLADATGEGFVMAIVAAYQAGKEAGKLAAQNVA